MAPTSMHALAFGPRWNPSRRATKATSDAEGLHLARDPEVGVSLALHQLFPVSYEGYAFSPWLWL